MNTLFKLTESVILYSVTLSNLLERATVPVRIVSAYRLAVQAGIRKPTDRMIDTLVRYIARNPGFIDQWADYFVLCVVSQVSTDTEQNIENMLKMRNINILAEVIYSVCNSQYYVDYKKLARILSYLKTRLVYCDYASLIFNITTAHPKLAVQYEYMNDAWLLNAQDMHVLYKSAVINTNMLGCVPANFIDYDMCKVAALNCEIDSIPIHFIDEKLCWIVMETNPSFAWMFPSEMITQDMCERAVIVDPSSILSFDRRLISEAVIVEILKSDPYVLKQLVMTNTVFPQVCRDRVHVLILESIIRDFTHYDVVSSFYINIDHDLASAVATINDVRVFERNPKLARFVCDVVLASEIVRTTFNLEFVRYLSRDVKQRVLTRDICRLLMDNSVYWIKYIPARFLTRAYCARAVKHNPSFITSVPDKFVTRDMCTYAVNARPVLVASVDFLFVARRFSKILEVAIKALPCVFDSIPECHITYDLCMLAVQSDPNCILAVPDHFRTDDILRKALRCGWAALTRDAAIHLLEVLPHIMKTCDTYEDAILQHPSIVLYIPSEFFENTIRSVISRRQADIQYLYKFINKNYLHATTYLDNLILTNMRQLVTHDCWRALVSLSPPLIKCAPPESLTCSICESIVETDLFLIQYVPTHLVTNKMITYMLSKYCTLNERLQTRLKELLQ